MKNRLNNFIGTMNYSINSLFPNVTKMHDCEIYVLNTFQKILNTVEDNSQNKGHHCTVDYANLTMMIKAKCHE